MGKGSSGMGAGSAAPTRMNASADLSDLNKALKTGFTNEGGGTYSLDTPYGGGQILDVSDNWNYGGTAYEARAWDNTYDSIGDMQVYSSLNAAKAAIKQKISDDYKIKHNISL